MSTDRKTGELLLGRYRIRRALGRGAHGRVYLADDLARGGSRVALKLVETALGATSANPAEALLRWFRHPAWAAVYDAGPLGEDARFQVTRFIPGSSLDGVDGTQPSSHVWRLLEDMARVLRALHGQGLIHYDITPGNVIRCDDHGEISFTLTDGGLAHVGPVRGVARGTPQFMAPELTEGGDHDHRVDLYSLGLVAYRLLTDRDPFSGGAGEVLKARREHDAPRASAHVPSIPPALDDLVASLLARDPNERPFDASTLLERIAEARDVGLPAFTEAEAVEAATGGPLVGRSGIIERFDATSRHLSQHLPEPSEEWRRKPISGLTEPVLVIRGEPGSGATHLVETMLAHAREEGLPAMLVAGRERAADRRGPLRRLADGIATLGREADESRERPRLDLRRGEGLQREERAHARGRAVEVFLKTVEEAAARTPFVIVVEDYGDLPELAQEAIQVLSRHLLSRAEHGGRQSQPAVALVVDVGTGTSDELLIPDSEDPERCVEELAPLAAGDLEAICQSRFGGLQILDVDRASLEQRTEGRPAVLAGLLSEAARRGDLKHEADAWHWDLERLPDYPIRRGISPQHAEALVALSDAERLLLEQMAQIDSSISATAMDLLCERAGLLRVPNTPLLSVLNHASVASYAIANRGVRHALLDSLTDDDRRDRARSLLSALEHDADPSTTIDRAALLLTTGDMAAALDLMDGSRHTWRSDDWASAQGLLVLALESCDGVALPRGTRLKMARCLGSGRLASTVARGLRKRLVPGQDSIATALHVCEALDSAEDDDEVRALAQTFLEKSSDTSVYSARLAIVGSRSAQRLRQTEQAWSLVKRARSALRSQQGDQMVCPADRIRLALVTCGLLFLDGEIEKAARLCRLTERSARRHGLRLMRAQALNNLGPALVSLGDMPGAITCFRRSARLKAALGDLHGAAQTNINLGRALERSGRSLEAATVLQAVSAVATRHAFATTSLQALRILAAIYDQELNSRLAADTYRRALTISRRESKDVQTSLIAADLAPLDAAHGHVLRARALLRECRGVGQTRNAPSLLWNCLKSWTLVGLHAGQLKRVKHLWRLLHSSDLSAQGTEASAWRVVVSVLLGEIPDEGAAALRQRDDLSRISRWLVRALRAPRQVPALPRELEPTGRHDRPRPSGPTRRLVLEALLSAARTLGGEEALHAIQKARRGASAAGEDGLSARTMAAQAAFDPDAVAAASLFSDAVDQLTRRDMNSPEAPRQAVPAEFIQAAQRLDATSANASGIGSVELNALAHRALRRHRLGGSGDDRLASALRRVLAATARMEAGGSLGDLLSDMTQSTLDVTRAERTCVVLVDQEDDPTPRVATSASDVSHSLTADDISHTVINRVIHARRPLLLHDVFDDEELLGRPSITNLSLRSIICVPMIRGDVLYGVMYADNASIAGSFDSTDLEVLELFAEQAAAALETNRLVADLQASMQDLKDMQERLVRGERLRTIGEMSSGVAHEFNNLLTSILARVQLLNLNYLAPDLKKDLHLIERACLDAAEVVRRLQNFSKQQRQGTFRPVDLSEVCRDAVEFLRPLWSTRRRRGRPPILVRMEADSPQVVRGDPTELREVLTNLVKNALDALDQGGTIVVRSAREDGQVRVTVSDDGPGIPEDVLPRVCDPFFTTKGERGTGLGLCLSQQIIERHSGSLAVDSEPGNGTRILITIPSAEDEAAQLPVIEHPAVRGMQGGSRTRILVVDDDANVREPLCEYLERAGFAVEAADSGANGLARAERVAPQVVISDIGMPGMDGIELCRRLRAQAPVVPVILMSGWATGVNPADARRAGAAALLAKPFAMNQVTELLARVLERQSA